MNGGAPGGGDTADDDYEEIDYKICGELGKKTVTVKSLIHN